MATQRTIRRRRERRDGRRGVGSGRGSTGGGAGSRGGGVTGRGRTGARSAGAPDGANTEVPGAAAGARPGRGGRAVGATASGAGTWTLRGSRRGLGPLTG